MREVTLSIQNVVDNATENIMQLLVQTRTGGSEVSHTMFQVFPTTEQRSFTECSVEPVSRWALDIFLERYEAREANSIAYLFRISQLPVAAPLRGHLFEKQVLDYFCGITSTVPFSIHQLGLGNSKQMTWTFRGPVRPINFRKSVFSKVIAEAVKNKTSVHLIPSERNFAAVDSILYDPGDPDAVLTCIQVTTSDNHPIAVKGLQAIQELLDPKNPLLKPLRPDKNRPWRFIFVVPSPMASTFQPQRLKGTAERAWGRKVHQYVLELTEQTIFGEITNSRLLSALPCKRGGIRRWR